jgi:tRNA pseudouridine38-40 synthase
VQVDVSADAFCHSMVRSIVGVLLAVGAGRIPEDRPVLLLATRRRTADIPVAPAHGLTLTGVDYPPDADLAIRAQLTRAVRATPSS